MSNGAHDPTRLQIGPWAINAEAREVEGPTGSTRIEPKAMSVLLELARAPDEVVGRQQLLERVWGAEMATDDVLSRAISELRRALGDDTRNPRFIVTVRGSGYRLVVPAPAAAVTDGETHAGAIPLAKQRSLSAPLIAALAGVAATLVAVVALRSAEPDGPVTAPDVRVTPLTSRPGQESAPRLSHDGTRVAYAWRDDSTQTQQVYVRLVDGSADVRITDGAGDYQLSAWSPDGARLVVTRTDRSALGIYEVPSLGGGTRLITRVSGPYILGLDWANDGRRLAYSALDSTTMAFGIRVLDLSSRRERRLTTGARDAFGDVYSTFSPDGRQVAFVRFFSEVAADVFVVATDGGEPQRLTHDERSIGSIAFDADGRSVLYSSNRDGRTAVWRVVVDESDSSPTKVYESSHGISGLAALRSPAGIVVAESDQDLNLWTVRADGSETPRQLAASTRLDALPAYSPNGAQIAFVSDRSGQSELWVSDTAGRDPVRLTQFGDVQGMPSWSPNGDRLAIEREVRGRSELWIVDVARRTASAMATSLRDALAPSWSVDGRSIYLTSRKDGNWDVFEVALDGGAITQLTTSGGMAARPMRDGRSILFAKPYARGLWRLDLATRVESLVTQELAAGDCTNWVPGAGGIYFVRRGGDGMQSIVFSANRGGMETVVAANVRVPVGSGGLSLSPDGRQLIYAQTDRRDGDLVRVEVAR